MGDPIVNSTSNGYVPVELISSLVEKVNAIDSFITDIGFGSAKGFLNTAKKISTPGWRTNQYGADEFRILTVRQKVPLRASEQQNNVVIPLNAVVGGARLGGPLTYDTIVLTPVAPTPESRAVDISLLIVNQTTESVTVKVTTTPKPARATYFILNMIAIAGEPTEGF